MARLETWYKQDLKRPLVVHKHTDVFNQDSKGNLIGVEVYSDGEPVALSGSISGYCLLADGTTVPAVGASRSGNKASILIPQTAYSVPGPITITIKNVEGNNITTLCATVGVVRQSVSGNLVNPGSVVTDWSNDINDQLQAVQTAVDNVGAIVAAPFDENTVYVVGNYVTNNGNLYRITADHASGVAWANTAKIQCTVGNELEALNNHFVADWNLIDPDASSSEETDFLPVELNIRYNIIHAQSKGRFQYGLSLYDSNKTMLYISQLVDESTDGTNYIYSCTFSQSAVAYVKLKINSAPSGIDTTDFSKVYFGKGSEYIEFDDYNVIHAIKKVKDDVVDLASDVSDLGSALGTVPSGKTAQGQIDDNANDISDLKSAVGDLDSHINYNFRTDNLIEGYGHWRFSSNSLSLTEVATCLSFYFPVTQGKKYTIVKPQTTSAWRIAYSDTLPATGTTLTNYNSSAPLSETHYTYTASVTGYLIACVCNGDSANIQDDVYRYAFAYAGEYAENKTLYSGKLVNVSNIPDNTGIQLDYAIKSLSETGNICLFPDDFELGTINSQGVITPSTTRLVTTDFIKVDYSDLYFISDGYFDITAIAYTDTQTYDSSHNIQYFNGNKRYPCKASYVRLILRKHTAKSSDITEDDLTHANICIIRNNPEGAVEHVTVMTHNVGHFNYGEGNGGYYGTDVADQIKVWRNMYRVTKPDIIALQEYYNYFDHAGTESCKTNFYDQIADFYKDNIFTSTDGRAIISKYYLHDKDTFTITATVGETTYTRNVLCAVANINGHDVLIASIHLSPGRGVNAASARLAQADDLITKINAYGYDKVIICGDFNCTEGSSLAVQTALFDKFVADGYTCLNNGYYGSFTTINSEAYGEEPLDSILVRGLKISGVETNADWVCTSDHYPLLGYVTIR